MGQKINIVMDQGASFTTTFNLIDENNNPLDLSSYIANSEMRINYSSINSYSFSANSYVNGAIILTMNASSTAVIWPGRYVYDIELTDSNNNVSRVIEGIVTVTPSVTH